MTMDLRARTGAGAAGLLAALLCLPGPAPAAPGDLLFGDDFESGALGTDWSTSGPGDAGVGTQTAASGSYSLYTRWRRVEVTSRAIDLSAVAAAELSLWLRRGDDAFSEDPDGNEDMVVEYRDASSAWVELARYDGNGPAGEVFNASFALPADALHGQFRLRLGQEGGSGSDFDYWHVDDVAVIERGTGGVCDTPGLEATFWDQGGVARAYFTGGTVTRIDAQVDFDWGSGQPDPGIGADDFTSRWEGFFEAPASGNYLFRTRSDDGVRLWVDGSLVIDEWNDHAPRYDTSASVSLQAGQRYSLRMEHYERGGQAVAALEWDLPGGGTSFQAVPASALFHCAAPLGAVAYYPFEETAWTGAAGEVLDASGNGNDGRALGGITTVDPGRVCRGAYVPANTTAAPPQAVDTGVDVDATLGNRGTIDFWYRSDTRWNGGGERMLLDASVAPYYFFLFLQNNGRLLFALEDSSDGDYSFSTSTNTYPAGTWVHVAVTWDLPGDRLEIYLDGVLAAFDTSNTNGVLGDMGSLHVGDARGGYHPGGSDASAGGTIDELRLYDRVLGAAEIVADMTATHPCGGIDHFAILHDGAAVNCQAEPVTIEAHDATHGLVTGYTGTVALATSTGNGDWSVITGNPANLVNGGSGTGSYQFDGSEGGRVVLGLRDTFVETVSIDVADGGVAEAPGEDPDLAFARSGFAFLAGGVQGAVGTQIGGKPSDLAPGAQLLELQAIRTSDQTGACEAALVGAQGIELAYECLAPATCDAATRGTLAIGGVPVAGNDAGTPLAYTGVTLDFGDATDGTAGFTLAYPDVGAIRLHARLAQPPGEALAGASNAFVVRPFGFALDVPGNPGATGPAGPAFVAAGDPFTVTATAVLWQAGDDADADGVPDGHADADPSNNAALADNAPAVSFGREGASLALGALLDQPAGGVDPGLAATITGFTAGSGADSGVRYQEVGIIEIAAAVAGGDYLGIGPAATTAMTSRSGHVGRFHPAYLTLDAGAVTNRADLACVPASVFGYLDEDLGLAMTVTARRRSGPPAQNYAGAFARLDTLPELGLAAVDTAGPTPLSGRLSAGSAGFAWAAGVGTITARARVVRQASPDGPFESVALGAAPVDDDGVALGAFDLDADADGSDDHARVADTRLRHGRLALDSAHGSELADLPVPLRVEHWDGVGFAPNPLDGCTALAMSDLTLSNVLESGQTDGDIALQPGIVTVGTMANVPFIGGAAGLSFCPPGSPACTPAAGNGGYLEIDVDASGLPYLRFDWDGDGAHDDDPPKARATFGIYRGNPRHIYLRERP